MENGSVIGFVRVIAKWSILIIGSQHSVISLRREDVDGFIFWTKNLGPFDETLNEVHHRSYPFVVQYTINGYPRELESRVVDTARAVATFRSASSIYGKRSIVWRYDTIIFSTFNRQSTFIWTTFQISRPNCQAIRFKRGCSFFHATLSENSVESGRGGTEPMDSPGRILSLRSNVRC